MVRELATQRKAAEQASRTAEALQAAVKAAERQAAEAAARSRALEATIGGGAGPARLAERNSQLKARVADLEATAASREAAFSSVERELEACQSEVAVLLRALEVRMADLGISNGGSGDDNHDDEDVYGHGDNRDRDRDRGAAVRAGLLYELALSERARGTLTAQCEARAASEKAARDELAACLGRLEAERRGRAAAEGSHRRVSSAVERAEARVAELEQGRAALEEERRALLTAVSEQRQQLARLERDDADWKRRALSGEAALAEAHAGRAKEVDGLGRQLKELTLRASQVHRATLRWKERGGVRETSSARTRASTTLTVFIYLPAPACIYFLGVRGPPAHGGDRHGKRETCRGAKAGKRGGRELGGRGGAGRRTGARPGGGGAGA